MDIRPSRDARRRADRQMGIQVRALNDKASERFDLAHARGIWCRDVGNTSPGGPCRAP